MSSLAVLRILSQTPSLVSKAPLDIIRHATELGSVLLTQPDKVLMILARKPSLLQLTPTEAAERFLDVSVALGLPLADSVPLVIRQPALLDAPPDSLSAQVDRLKLVLMMPSEGVAMVLSRLKPNMLRSVLLASNSVLREQLEDVQAVLMTKLGDRCPNANLFVIRNPSLLLIPIKSLAATIDRLAVIFSLPQKQRCHLLTIPAQQLQINFRGILKSFRIDSSSGSSLVATEPRLLQVSPDKLLHRVEALQLEMYLPRFQALNMVVRQPQLMLYQPQTLQANMLQLKSVLNVSYDIVVVLVGKHPNLLFFSRRALKSKLDVLSTSLGLPAARIEQLVLLEPVLLTLSAMRLEETIAELCITLNVTTSELGRVVVQEPSIILFGGRVVDGRLTKIANILDLEKETVASMMTRKPAIMKYDVEYWQKETLASMMVRKPAIMKYDVEYWQKETLASMMVRKPAIMKYDWSTGRKCASMMARKPAIMRDDVENWQTNLDSLTSVLGLSVVTARKLVCLAPGLLALKPVLLHNICALLQSLINTSPSEWVTQLAEAKPAQLRKMIMYRRKEMEHLQFLSDSGLQSSMSIFSTKLYNRRGFAERFPEFEKWQRQKTASSLMQFPGGDRVTSSAPTISVAYRLQFAYRMLAPISPRGGGATAASAGYLERAHDQRCIPVAVRIPHACYQLNQEEEEPLLLVLRW
eukprot:gene22792-29959_t